MPKFQLTTFIAAPIGIVFDLARSIDLHLISTAKTGERVINGVSSGLVKAGDTVTWQAKHFFKTRKFTSAIRDMQSPDYFSDEMVEGDFQSFRHEHHFRSCDNGTIMIDQVSFESPYGAVGRLANRWFLEDYLKKFINERNAVITSYAETGKWRSILEKEYNGNQA